MKHIGVFSGKGGFEYAAEIAGIENIASCEINPFGQRILNYYWPDAYHHEDIKTLNYELLNRELINRFGSEWRSGGLILTGGFPCQDNSRAKQNGERKLGLKGKRTGLAWQQLRLIREIRPDFMVAENVADILTTNDGEDFGVILNELAGMGYNAEWRVCYASEHGAPHQRARLYLVAYPSSIRQMEGQTFIPYVQKEASSRNWVFNGAALPLFRGGTWTSEPPLLLLDDGVSAPLHGITVSQWRRSSIEASGNAIVPQVALEIFKAIQTIFLKEIN